MTALGAGTPVGRYRIEEWLSDGVASSRYRARQEDLSRSVIIDVASARAGTAEAERFLARGRGLAVLDHPNVLRVYEVGVADGVVFAASADVAGEPLDALLGGAPISGERAADIVAQVAAAAEALGRPGDPQAELPTEGILVASAETAPQVFVDGLAAEAASHSGALATGGPGLSRLLATLVSGLGTRAPPALRPVIERGLSQRRSYASGSALAAAANAALREHRRRVRRRNGLLAAVAALVAVATTVVAVTRGGDEPTPRTSVAAAAADAPAARIAAKIPLGRPAGAMAFGDGSVWLHLLPHSLVRVDGRTAEVVGHPIDLGKRFSPFAIAAGGGSVYSSLGGTLIRIDERTGRIAGRLPLAPATVLSITLAGGVLWAGVSTAPGLEPVVNDLVRVDPGTMKTVGRRVPVGFHPSDIAVSGTTVLVTNGDGGTVTSVATDTGAARTVRLSGRLNDSAIVGRTLWVTSPVDRMVMPVDGSTLLPPDEVVRPGGAYGLASLGGALWTTAFEGAFPDGGRVSLSRIDLRTRRLAGRPLQLGTDAGVPVAGDGALWISSRSDKALLKVVPTSPAPRPKPAPSPEPSPRRLRPGPLARGEWRVDGFTPHVRFTLAERGWLNSSAPGLIGLARSDRPDLFVTVASPRRVMTATQRLQPATSARAVLNVFRENALLQVGRTETVDVGGLRATRVAVAVEPGHHLPAVCQGTQCAPIFPFPGGTFLLERSTDNRLYLIDAPGRVVLVSVEVPRGSPQSDFDLADRVVRSLRFDPA